MHKILNPDIYLLTYINPRDWTTGYYCTFTNSLHHSLNNLHTTNYHLSIIRFYMKTGFPGVCGSLDCTLIAIVPPSGILRIENDYSEHISCMLSLSSNVFPGFLSA